MGSRNPQAPSLTSSQGQIQEFSKEKGGAAEIFFKKKRGARTYSPFGSPIGLIHQPRNFLSYEVFLQINWCSNGVLEQIDLGCPTCNFGQLREIAKI